MIARLVELLSMPLGDLWFLFVQWLRRPRWAKRGTLAPVIVTHDGVAVPSIARVPIRSTKADGKRQALAWARRQFNDPTLSWGQARKRLRRLERELREDQRDRMASAAIAAAGGE